MTSGDRPDGDSGIDNPDIRDPGVDNPDLRDGGVGNPDIREPGIDNPDIRDPGVDNPEIREPGIDNPDIMPGPQPMSGGLPVIPIAIGAGIIVIAIAAFAFFGGPSGTPARSQAPGAATAAVGATTPIATAGASAPAPTAGVGGPGTEGTATLEVSGPDVQGSWSLERSSGNISPTDELLAGIWTESTSNLAEGYGELVTVSMSGTIVEGTQATAAAGLVLGFAIARFDASGNDLFSHVVSSRAGECQVTMARMPTGVSGTFTCPSITDADGHTMSATGSFAT